MHTHTISHTLALLNDLEGYTLIRLPLGKGMEVGGEGESFQICRFCFYIVCLCCTSSSSVI